MSRQLDHPGEVVLHELSLVQPPGITAEEVVDQLVARGHRYQAGHIYQVLAELSRMNYLVDTPIDDHTRYCLSPEGQNYYTRHVCN